MKDTLRICGLDKPPGDRPFYLVTTNPPQEQFRELLCDAIKEFLEQFGDGIRFL